MTPDITPFFDKTTSTWSYLVVDSATNHCAIVDPVLDFDPASGRVTSLNADRLEQAVRERGLTVDYLLETHVHADHLSASHHLKARLGGEILIGRHVDTVQHHFGLLFNAGPSFATDGRQFDRLLDDGEPFDVGQLSFTAMHTPGHTPACMTYVVGNAAFIGDTLFMPDYGTARCDFPGGDAGALYDSIQRILALPAETELYLCHDYLPAGRDEYRFRTPVADAHRNVQLAGLDKAEFVAAREARDRELPAPRLLLPSIQVNMRAGELPPAEDNETRYLKIPLTINTTP